MIKLSGQKFGLNTIITLLAIYLSFKENKGLKIFDLILAYCFSTLYVIYWIAVKYPQSKNNLK
ncbi:hypothetical protein CPAV1605_1092 [seawater metagenome]|uniref:Uncharacterized protein n=1 Tax=seawater metagenome TaxID=1561972 RepID=A0A5E8CJ99_9ZZZZ